MTKLTALITGGNDGIGKATAIALAAKGIETIIISRDKQRGLDALQDIKKTAQANVNMIVGDLADLSSVRAIAHEFNANYPHLDILINNAGVYVTKSVLTIDGFEMQIGVNHLAHFLLTHLLLDKIKAAPKGRIVVVSSNTHYMGKIKLDSFVGLQKRYSGIKAYGQSKLANLLFAKELSRRLVGTAITVNALNPGRVNTQMPYKNSNGLTKFVWGMLKPTMISPEKGAATSIMLATSTKVAHVTGKYFDNKKLRTPSKLAMDEKLANDLWKYSESLVFKNGR